MNSNIRVITMCTGEGEYTLDKAEFLAEQLRRTSGLPLEVHTGSGTYPGWWAKMTLFRIHGPVVYLDLSAIPVGDIAPLSELAQSEPFTIMRDFNPKQRLFQSSVMTWSGDLSIIADQFEDDATYWMNECTTARWWGDQGCVERLVFENNLPFKYSTSLLPGAIVSYKKHCGAGTPDGARVVVFHGRPKWWHLKDFAWLNFR